MRRVRAAWARRFARDRGGVAAVEFACVLTILILLAFVAIDLGRYAIFTRKVNNAAATMADLLALNSTGTVTQDDLDSVFRTQLVVFPEVMTVARQRGIWVWSAILSSLSGVQFKLPTGCKSNCSYTPYVAWTSGQGRPCGTPLAAASATTVPSPSTLPADIFGSGFLVVADVVFTYIPMFTRSVVGTVTIRRSFYVAPRYVAAIAFDASAGTSYAWGCTIP